MINKEIKNGKYKYPNRIEYFSDGQKHRESGPAIEWSDGGCEWWFEGQRHREDGPAIEMADGSKYWYISGKQYTEEDFNQWKMKKQLKEKLTSSFNVNKKNQIKERKI